MAPEVLSGQSYSQVADIWGVGCVIVECLTGQPPYAELSDGKAGCQAQFLAISKITNHEPPRYPRPPFISPGACTARRPNQAAPALSPLNPAPDTRARRARRLPESVLPPCRGAPAGQHTAAPPFPQVERE
jgi:serine/threonine protein kinase